MNKKRDEHLKMREEIITRQYMEAPHTIITLLQSPWDMPVTRMKTAIKLLKQEHVKEIQYFINNF